MSARGSLGAHVPSANVGSRRSTASGCGDILPEGGVLRWGLDGRGYGARPSSAPWARWSRMRRIRPGSVMSETTRMSERQPGQYSANVSLTAGSRIGPYEIVSAIGAGGMGEVYKARDTRLNRTVAIKVLPRQLRPLRRCTSTSNGRRKSSRGSPISSATPLPHRDRRKLGRVRKRRHDAGFRVSPGRLRVRVPPFAPSSRLGYAAPCKRARLFRLSERPGLARVCRRLQPHASHWTSHRIIPAP
jgi:Protein kinase domain.